MDLKDRIYTLFQNVQPDLITAIENAKTSGIPENDVSRIVSVVSDTGGNCKFGFLVMMLIKRIYSQPKHKETQI